MGLLPLHGPLPKNSCSSELWISVEIPRKPSHFLFGADLLYSQSVVWGHGLYGACGACHLGSGLSRAPAAVRCGRLSVRSQRRNDSQLFAPERTDLSWACGLCLTWVFSILWLMKLSWRYLLIKFWPRLKKRYKNELNTSFVVSSFQSPLFPVIFLCPSRKQQGSREERLWPAGLGGLRNRFHHHVLRVLTYKSFLLRTATVRVKWKAPGHLSAG